VGLDDQCIRRVSGRKVDPQPGAVTVLSYLILGHGSAPQMLVDEERSTHKYEKHAYPERDPLLAHR
jgi:hypothetical protein